MTDRAGVTRRELLGQLALLAGGCWCGRGRSAALPQHNALWTQSSFLRGSRPSTGARTRHEDLTRFGDLLRRNRIRYPYLFAGPFTREGHVPAYASAPFARAALRTLHARAPDAVLMPWLGGLQHKQVFLQEPSWVATAVQETRALLETLELSAVHVNFEYLLFGRAPDPSLRYNDRFIAFFEALRAALPRTIVSTVIPSSAPTIHPWKYQHSPEDVLAFLPFVDQLAVLYYDTHLHDRGAFERGLATQLEHLARWRAAAAPRSIELLVATGTFVNELPHVRAYRDLAIENIPDSLSALRRAIARRADRRPVLDGIAVYCDWETDAAEWADLRAGWFDRG